MPVVRLQGQRPTQLRGPSDRLEPNKMCHEQRAGRANWRRRQLERVERREVVHTRETFGEFFPRWLTRRKPYLEEGSWSCYERDGRIRLLPALESVPLGVMEVEHVRDLMDVMTEGMEAGEIAPKTVNNTLTTLVVCLNEAIKDKADGDEPGAGDPQAAAGPCGARVPAAA
ncbi:MAG: hypothetical protein ACRDLF_01535 [Solirubrobacteraceae bacterium]